MTRRSGAWRWFVCSAAISLSAGVSARAGSIDVRLNAYTTGSQGGSAVVMDAAGNFVVVWNSMHDGDSSGVFGRRFDVTGAAVGPEFQVNSYTTNAQKLADVAMSASGEFVVVWQSARQDGSFGGIFGQLFDAEGGAVGSEFQVNSESTNVQRYPSVAMDGSGRFVVVWESYTPAGLWDIRGRRFDASGTPLDNDFVVNAYTTDLQQNPTVAMDAGGNFVIVWESDRPRSDCLSPRAIGRRFDSFGAPLGGDFALGSEISQSQSSPTVAMAAGGSFMVAWHGGGCGVNAAAARAFDAAGTPRGSEFLVDTTPGRRPDAVDLSSVPAVAADTAGNFVIAWGRKTYADWDDGIFFNTHIRVRRYDGSGNPLGPASPADTEWRDTPGNPSVAAGMPGTFVVTWNNGGDVFARSPDVLFGDGFESGDLTSWSAASTDGGDLVPAHAARMGDSPPVIETLRGYGLQATVDDQAGIFVQDDTPAGETRYRARFYLDPNGFDPGEAISQFRQHVFLGFQAAPQKRLLLIILKRQGGVYSIAAHVRRDDETLAMTPFVPIADGPSAIEFDWQRASAPGADDGRLELWVNGVSSVTLTGLDNDMRGIDFVRMGAMSVKPGASGTLFFDEFVSRRLRYSGP